jgi:hypothetical protein
MNWKTTATGVLGALISILTITKAVLSGQPFDPALVTGIITGIGLIFAADAKK